METKLQRNIKVPLLPKTRPDSPNPNEFPKKYEDENFWIWDMFNKLKTGFTTAIEPLK